MTAMGTGANRGMGLSHNPLGGGQYFYDGSTSVTPALHVEEVQARDPLPGATRVYFSGFLIDETGGAPTPPDRTVGLYYKTTEQTPKNLGTILNAAKVSGPGSAPIIVGNKVTQVTFDNISVYSVEWQAATDGLSDQDPHTLMPHVE